MDVIQIINDNIPKRRTKILILVTMCPKENRGNGKRDETQLWPVSKPGLCSLLQRWSISEFSSLPSLAALPR